MNPLSLHRFGDATGSAARRPARGAEVWSTLLAGSVLCFACLSFPFASIAQTPQAGTTYGEEAKTRLELAQRVAPLTEDGAFGEQIGQFTGSLSFRYVDVSLPGNDQLKVEFARVVSNEYSPNFWGWDIDVPQITTLLPHDLASGWTSNPPEVVYNANRADFQKSDYWNGFRMRVDGQSQTLLSRQFNEKGALADPLVPAGPGAPTDWKFMTKSGWLFRALPALGRPGEYLEARSPDGLTYRFDHLVVRQYDQLQHPTKIRISQVPIPGGGFVGSADPELLPRDVYVMYVSRVTDRFGNYVNYNWDGGRLDSIVANDGRRIDIDYEVTPAGFYEPKVVTANGREWHYQYARSDGGSTTVANPDGSVWRYEGVGWFDVQPIDYVREDYAPGLQNVLVGNLKPIGTCTKAYPFTPDRTRTMKVTAPSGATAEYLLRPMRHGRASTPLACNETGDERNSTTRIPRYVDGWTLERKTVSGPGVEPVVSSYEYSGLDLTFHPSLSAYVPGELFTASPHPEKTVTVTRSDGEVRKYIFGRKYGENEGLLLAEEMYGPAVPSANVESGKAELKRYRRTEYSHVPLAASESHGFASSWGTSGVGFSDNFTNWHTPVKRTTVIQDGVRFVSEVQAFDRYVSPTTVAKYSENAPGFSGYTGYSKVETYQSYNNEAQWVLRQPGTQSVNGIEVSRIVYNPSSALPQQVYRFNEAQPSQTIAYYPGTALVSSVSDARGKVTQFSEWTRGVPKSITFHDGTRVSALVDDNGWVTRVTDQAGFSTCYGYDPMGRVNRVRPPGDATCASVSVAQPSWEATSIVFARSTQSEWGLPVGHWVRTETRGTAASKGAQVYNKVTRFDALWRPVMQREWDSASPSTTERYTAWKYDSAGRQTFVADPRATATSVASFGRAGVHTEFDPLGRPVRSYRPSELGFDLVTSYFYEPGFVTRVVNPRQNSPIASTLAGSSTVTRFQAYDSPDTSMPVRIEAPENVVTQIVRDVFGKPTSIIRSGSFDGQPQSVTRRYVYDAQQRLCKRVEPETGATVMDYDPAGNLLWSASGLSLPGLGCDRSSVAESVKVRRSYDDLNRLSHLTFPDGLGNQHWIYTADGLPDTVTTQNGGSASVVNSYTYNNRRLLESETASHSDGTSWMLGYNYDRFGHLSSHVYPSGAIVDYSPNALGQATRAGTRATGARYYPNGALHTFNYGNGLVHTMTQNARSLPERSRAAGLGVTALDDSYDYDENGNVAGITDALPGQRGNREMFYDGLDRLTRTNSTTFGLATYTYDALDNLRSVSVGSGPRSRSHTYLYDANQRLNSVTNTSTGAQVLAMAYDAQGNLSSRTGQTFSFDFGNRLREVPGVEQYRYDAHGRRVRAISPTLGTIDSVYGNDGVLRFQRDARANTATDFVYLAGSMVARVSFPIAAGPVPPTLSAPATSTGSYTVSWGTSSGATTYRLEERVGGGGFEEVQSGTALNRPFTNKPSGTYAYRLRACATSLVSSCGAYSAIVQVVVSALPPAPVLSAPATSATGSFTVSWTSSQGATVYRLESLANGVWSELQQGSQRERAFSGQPVGSYSYRVRACATSLAASCGAYSNTVTVVVGLPPPALTAPSASTNGSYTVSWTQISGATRYRLEEQSNAGAWSEIQSTNALNRPVSGKPDGLYGYRVRACATDTVSSCSAYSNTASVSVSLLPPAPVLSAPDTSSNGSYTVSWTTPSGASYYRLDERQGSGSWQPVQAGTASSRAFTGKGNGSYEYRVRACRSALEAECGAYSATRTVVVNLIALPPAPVLTAPASSTTGSYTVSWTSVSGGSFYRLEERANGGSWSELQNQAATSRNVSGKGSGTYEYRVRACRSTDVAECGSFSNVATVTVSIAAVPPVPSISGPASSSPDFAFRISWSATTGATSYELQQNRNGGAWQNVYTGAALFQDIQRGLGGNYGYRVRACSAQGCSSYSTEHYVFVDGGPVLPLPPTLTAPASSSTGFYSLSWTASTHAIAYRVEEQSNGGSWAEIYNGPNTALSISSRPTGSFAYRVRACASTAVAGCGGYSDMRTVAVSLVQIPAAPAGLSVPATSTGSYTVSWSASSGASVYRLEEQLNGGGWSEVYAGANLSQGFSGKPAGTYSYRVRACASVNLAECSVYAGPVTVLVSSGTVIPGAPTLTAPASNGSGSFDLSWTIAAGANRYRLEESTNGGAWVEIQNTTSSAASISGKPNGSYRYRVRACSSTNVSDCGGYSNEATVNVSIAQVPASPPALTGPSSTSADFQFTLSWNSVTHATRYELEQSRNGGGWSNVYTGNALSWTVQRGPATFAYRVRACSDAGCSAYSASHTVVVQPSGG
jgi:YD repeat-containing protein